MIGPHAYSARSLAPPPDTEAYYVSLFQYHLWCDLIRWIAHANEQSSDRVNGYDWSVGVGLSAFAVRLDFRARAKLTLLTRKRSKVLHVAKRIRQEIARRSEHFGTVCTKPNARKKAISRPPTKRSPEAVNRKALISRLFSDARSDPVSYD
jgi:hypothetical protein